MTTTLPTSNVTKMLGSTQIQSGIGLLTTVAQLPAKYKIRYLARTVMAERPLDLTMKQELQQQTVATILPTSQSTVASAKNNNATSSPMTPPPSPPKKRYRDENIFITNVNDENVSPSKKIKTTNQDADDQVSPKILKDLTTPSKQQIKITSAPKTSKSHTNTIAKDKKAKAIRKLKFDEETSSPVSGTIIRPIEEILENIDEHQSGDIDPQYNIVEITEEAKSEIAAIRNVIGAYICKLCRIEFDDAFGLAQHRCSCIVLLEYRCPECGKRFNCPANLASHRRWHKPKEEVLRKQQENLDNEQNFPCPECGKHFKRQAYLRKHLVTHKNRENSEKPKTKQKVNRKNSHTSSNNSYKTTTNSVNSASTDDCSSQSSYNQPSVMSSNNSGYKDTRPYKYDSDLESDIRSECSSPGRLQIIENNMTEEENIAAAALAHLRNGPSVIQHTHATMAF